MSSQNKLEASINIGGRMYPMIVKNEEELKLVRAVETDIKQRIHESTEMYDHLDLKDHLALILFKVLSNPQSRTDFSVIDDQLDALCNAIVQHLDATPFTSNS